MFINDISKRKINKNILICRYINFNETFIYCESQVYIGEFEMRNKLSQKHREQIWKPLGPPIVTRKSRKKIWPITSIGPNKW